MRHLRAGIIRLGFARAGIFVKDPYGAPVFRGTWGRGFRAPSLWDLHSPPAFGNTANAVTDPGCPAALIADEDARCVDTQLNVRNISAPA